MAKNRIKKVVKVKDEETEMGTRTLVFTFVAMILLSLFIYFLTDVMKKKEASKKQEEIVEIDNNKILLGNLFNQSDKEYYVLVYDYKDKFIEFFDDLKNQYHDPRVKLYESDLKDGLNRRYIAEESNPKATSLDDLKISKETLIKISEGKIVKFLEGPENIRPELEKEEK
ncbi:MAG: hypothetical protein GX864_00020 [Mollicutes bacterium]|nr:hypothetical protein [Mollicutes bacterium]